MSYLPLLLWKRHNKWSAYGNQWAVEITVSNAAYINCGSDAGLDNLADNALTVEGWYLHRDAGHVSWGSMISKSDWGMGWNMYFAGSPTVAATVYTATGTQPTVTYAFEPDSKWHHWAMTWDDAGDRKTRLFFDGILKNTSPAATDPINPDASLNLMIGGIPIYYMNGYVGWVRISNNVRYVTTFSPSRTPPAIDANTLAQWNMNEGSGTTVDNAEGTSARDGTIINGIWRRQ